MAVNLVCRSELSIGIARHPQLSRLAPAAGMVAVAVLMEGGWWWGRGWGGGGVGGWWWWRREDRQRKNTEKREIAGWNRYADYPRV